MLNKVWLIRVGSAFRLVWRSLTPPSKIGKGSGEPRIIDLCHKQNRIYVQWNLQIKDKLVCTSTNVHYSEVVPYWRFLAKITFYDILGRIL